MKSRTGTALLELLTVTVLLVMLATACAALIRANAVVVLASQDRSATDEAKRIAAAVMSSELRNAASADIALLTRDSVRMRVMRGFAVVCGQVSGKILARYRGLRAPDASKDSILIAGEDAVTDFKTTARGAANCPAGAQEEIIALQTTKQPRLGAVMLFFELGNYYLTANALRYRRGGEGKQPLTEDRVPDGAIDLTALRRLNFP